MKFLLLGITFLFLTSHAEAKGRPKRILDSVVENISDAAIAPPQDKEICFSPEGHCDVKLWKLIQTAQVSLDIAIFDLTHPKIAHEIMAAALKMPVRVLVDRRQAKGPHSLVSLLVKAGVPVRIGSQRGIMHNKFTIVDATWIETGSFNYTDGATSKNNENQIYLKDPAIVGTYHQRFEKIWAEGTPPSGQLSHVD